MDFAFNKNGSRVPGGALKCTSRSSKRCRCSADHLLNSFLDNMTKRQVELCADGPEHSQTKQNETKKKKHSENILLSHPSPPSPFFFFFVGTDAE